MSHAEGRAYTGAVRSSSVMRQPFSNMLIGISPASRVLTKVGLETPRKLDPSCVVSS